MAQSKLDKDHYADVEETMARVKRLAAGLNMPLATSTFEKEIITVLQQDNEKLVTEIERLRQVVSDLRAQRSLEGARALELEFPRKRKSQSTSKRRR